jgi:hypothetical protein
MSAPSGWEIAIPGAVLNWFLIQINGAVAFKAHYTNQDKQLVKPLSRE